MLVDENPGKKLFENIRPCKKLVGILGDPVALEIVGTISSFSVSDPLKRRPLRDHGNVPYVYGHIVLVAQSTSPYCDIATADRRSNCCPCVCRLPRLCADIRRLKCGRWISFDDCGIYSRLQSNAELVEPIWGLKKTTVQLDRGEI